ncbi:hypothetical protein PTTG_11428, partial [Puccinia triticina 1-1 BBBD Race 1]
MAQPLSMLQATPVSQPLGGQQSWDEFQGNYDPLGTHHDYSLTPGHDPHLIPGNNLSGHQGVDLTHASPLRNTPAAPPFGSNPASSVGNNSLALRGPNHPPAESLSGSNPPD